MPIQDARRLSTLKTEPLRNFKFHVKFTPVDTYTGAIGEDLWTESTMGGFTSISGLSVTTDPISYREGGYNTSVHQIPGLTTFTPISMQRGVMKGNAQAIKSMGRLFSATSDRAGQVASDTLPNFRYQIDVYVFDHPRDLGRSATDISQAAAQFTVYNAWIASVAYSDLQAGENGIFVEQMSWVHEGFEASLKDAGGIWDI